MAEKQCYDTSYRLMHWVTHFSRKLNSGLFAIGMIPDKHHNIQTLRSILDLVLELQFLKGDQPNHKAFLLPLLLKVGTLIRYEL